MCLDRIRSVKLECMLSQLSTSISRNPSASATSDSRDFRSPPSQLYRPLSPPTEFYLSMLISPFYSHIASMLQYTYNFYSAFVYQELSTYPQSLHPVSLPESVSLFVALAPNQEPFRSAQFVLPVLLLMLFSTNP
jgi:hypothetical protein